MSATVPEWVSWVTGRGVYGYTHRVVAWEDGRPVKTACGKVVGERWRESDRGLRCSACHRLYGRLS